MFKPTPAHNGFLSALRDGKCNLRLDAVAGSGKTSTICWAMAGLPTDLRIAYFSFARKNVDDVKPKLPKGHCIDANTMHSLGLSAIRKATGRSPKLENFKASDLLKDRLGRDDFNTFAPTVLNLLSKAMAVGLCPSTVPGGHSLVRDEPGAWLDLADKFEIEAPEDDAVLMDRAIEITRKLIAECLRDLSVVSFDEMLYAPTMLRFPFPKYDVAFFDEAQDLSPVQRAMMHQLGCRIVAVGDERQAIYAFRGADSDSLNAIGREFECESHLLAKSYRCPQAIVGMVQGIVPHFEVGDANPVGSVEQLGVYTDKTLELFQPTDLIVCRNNAPLVALAWKLIRARIPCRLLGRDVGQGLLALIKKLKPRDLANLSVKLDEHVKRESKKFEAMKDGERRLAAMTDKTDTLRMFIGEAKDLADLGALLTNMFPKKDSEDNAEVKTKVTLGTVHKVKGAETERLYILDAHLMPAGYAKTPEAKLQEANIEYVSISRTRNYLGFIESPAKDGE